MAHSDELARLRDAVVEARRIDRLGRPHGGGAPMYDEIGMWASIVVVESCWEWSGHADRKGYGRLSFRGKRNCTAHRVMYELIRGPIPEGMTLDHLCRNRRCVNPEHLEPVPNRVNVLRGVGRSAENHRKTHCKHGHPLSGSNVRLYLDRGSVRRACVTCFAARGRSIPDCGGTGRKRQDRFRDDSATTPEGHE